MSDWRLSETATGLVGIFKTLISCSAFTTALLRRLANRKMLIALGAAQKLLENYAYSQADGRATKTRCLAAI
jgi:hypothetical protein